MIFENFGRKQNDAPRAKKQQNIKEPVLGRFVFAPSISTAIVPIDVLVCHGKLDNANHQSTKFRARENTSGCFAGYVVLHSANSDVLGTMPETGYFSPT